MKNNVQPTPASPLGFYFTLELPKGLHVEVYVSAPDMSVAFEYTATIYEVISKIPGRRPRKVTANSFSKDDGTVVKLDAETAGDTDA